MRRLFEIEIEENNATTTMEISIKQTIRTRSNGPESSPTINSVACDNHELFRVIESSSVPN